jgi:hypothetical protein
MAGIGQVFDRCQLQLNGSDIYGTAGRVNNTHVSVDGRALFVHGFSPNHSALGVIYANKEIICTTDIVLATNLTPIQYENYDYDTTNAMLQLTAATQQYNTTNVYNGGWMLVLSSIAWARSNYSFVEGTSAITNVTFMATAYTFLAA